PDSSDEESREKEAALKEELALMGEHEQQLDDLTRKLTNALSLIVEDPTDKAYAYVNVADLRRAVIQNEDGEEVKMTIAVRAGSNEASVDKAELELAIRCPQGLHAMVITSGKDNERGVVRDVEIFNTIGGNDQAEQENNYIVLPTSMNSSLSQPC
ncbi:hypothetical protein PMAYCL1PPCAC_21255, partial [Pristionchus mayeri]